MGYLEQAEYQGGHAYIKRRLKACAGAIISNALTLEHIPSSARTLMGTPIIHNFVHDAFRDVVVDCLAAYFDNLEEQRKEVLEAIVSKTQSKYGMRLRLVRSAVERMTYSKNSADLIQELERRVTPEMYGASIAVIRQEYARQ